MPRSTAGAPRAAARGGVGRPRRWLGAQMRSLRAASARPWRCQRWRTRPGAGTSSPDSLRSVARCWRGASRRGGGHSETRTATRATVLKTILKTAAPIVFARKRSGNVDARRSERVRRVFRAGVPDVGGDRRGGGCARGSSASAAAASASEAARREERDDFSEKDDSLLDDDLDLDAHASLGNVSSSRMLERLEGEAAQEVRAAGGALGDPSRGRRGR